MNMNTAVLPASHLRQAHQAAFRGSGGYHHGPTHDKPFVAYHEDFDKLIEGAQLKVVSESEEAVFHEAGVWVDSKVFVTSNRLVGEVVKGKCHGMVAMALVDLDGGVTSLPSTSALPAANGACMFQDQLLVCDQGYGQDQPSQLVLMNPSPPYTTTPVLNNFYGRPFNSLNDVIVVPTPGHEHSTIWFTDPAYGHEQGFKPAPQLPSQVYVFDPYSGGVRVVADGFVKPNGIVYDVKRKRAYVTDTGMIRGCGTINGSGPGTIYAFDVEFPLTSDPTATGPQFSNRRVFAFTDSGAPDGIKLDAQGNVFAGCFDGVHVWNAFGTLLGKIVLTSPQGTLDGCANLCFTPRGLVCLAEKRVYVVSGLK